MTVLFKEDLDWLLDTFTSLAYAVEHEYGDNPKGSIQRDIDRAKQIIDDLINSAAALGDKS